MNDFWTGIVQIGTLIVGVAIVAALVSPNARTSQVVQAGGNAFSTALGTALSPVTGNTGQFSGTSAVSII